MPLGLLPSATSLLVEYEKIRELTKVGLPVCISLRYMMLTTVVNRLKPTVLLYGSAMISEGQS